MQGIRKVAEDLRDFVNDLLNRTKVEAGKTVATPSTFTVTSRFGLLHRNLRPPLASDSVALLVNDATDIPVVWRHQAYQT